MARGVSTLKDPPSKNPRAGHPPADWTSEHICRMQRVMEFFARISKIKNKEDREATPKYGVGSH
jgi:hypothetical protein